MRRVLFAAALTCLAGVATACPPAPPPGWSPARVLGIEIDQPVQAGSTFDATVTVTDDQAVTSVGLVFDHPASVALDDRRFDVHQPITCEPAAVVPPRAVRTRAGGRGAALVH